MVSGTEPLAAPKVGAARAVLLEERVYTGPSQGGLTSVS